jgi:hypothetical protein
MGFELLPYNFRSRVNTPVYRKEMMTQHAELIATKMAEKMRKP